MCYSLNIPRHVAIVMDGNRRWAKLRNLPDGAGHLEGARRLNKIADYAQRIGIEYLTLFAFSTENWTRSEKEVNFLMILFENKLRETLNTISQNIKIKIIGRKTKLSDKLLHLSNELENLTKDNKKMTLNIAIDYGSREEILNASRQITRSCLENKMSIDDIDEESFNKFLYTNESPDVDLFIRTSGEKRVSNFLLWQSSYAEFIFLDILWPDFSTSDLDYCIEEFKKRNRTFGKDKFNIV